jgi:hypothetical protein
MWSNEGRSHFNVTTHTQSIMLVTAPTALVNKFKVRFHKSTMHPVAVALVTAILAGSSCEAKGSWVYNTTSSVTAGKLNVHIVPHTHDGRLASGGVAAAIGGLPLAVRALPWCTSCLHPCLRACPTPHVHCAP